MQFLAAVTLVVPDYDAAITFYVGKLGFGLLEDTPLANGKRWVKVMPQGAQTALLLAKASDAEQSAVIGNQTGGRVAFFLRTDDFDKEFARMSANGVKFLEIPRTETYGKVVVFADPFGNRWDLIGA